MWKNKIIIVILLFFIALLGALYYYRYTIYSSYIIQKVGSLDVIQEYTQSDYNSMKLVGAQRAGLDKKTVIWLDGQINNNTKKVSVQYYCKIVCTIYSIGIYDSNKRNIVYGEEKNINWIENGSEKM